jgi:hypothetical protein
MEQHMRQIMIGFAIGCVIGCVAVLLGLRRGHDGQTALQRVIGDALRVGRQAAQIREQQLWQEFRTRRDAALARTAPGAEEVSPG